MYNYNMFITKNILRMYNYNTYITKNINWNHIDAQNLKVQTRMYKNFEDI